MSFKITPITPSKIKKILTLVTALILLIASLNSNDSTPTLAPDKTPPLTPISTPNKATSTPEDATGTSFKATVKSVVDGDTIKILKLDTTNRSTVASTGLETTTVRLIGINTPETVDLRRPVECFGKEASNKAKEILLGQNIIVELDSTQGTKDKYGRLLAYIYLEKDGIFFNKYMIEQGYAYEYTYDMPYKYQSQFKEAEKKARDLKSGLWAEGVCVKII